MRKPAPSTGTDESVPEKMPVLRAKFVEGATLKLHDQTAGEPPEVGGQAGEVNRIDFL